MRLDKEYAIYTQIDKQMDLKSYYLQIIFFLHYGSFFFFFLENRARQTRPKKIILLLKYQIQKTYKYSKERSSSKIKQKKENLARRARACAKTLPCRHV